MDILSEATKKETHSLLAAGFAGIIVGQLKVYPTDIELVGVKFHNPDLPLIAVGGLCAALVYLLIKFCFSYLYEQSSSQTQILAMQIRDRFRGRSRGGSQEACRAQAKEQVESRIKAHSWLGK